MPWIKDQNNEDVYQVSQYAKEELPTWSEVYEEFYKNRLYIPDEYIKTLDVEDIYWKIKHNKFLMITICNQFNKMITEDGYRDTILQVCQKMLDGEVVSVTFILLNYAITDQYYLEAVKYYTETLNEEVPIYYVPMPDGKENPFIISKNRMRISSSDIDDKLILYPIIVSRDEDGDSSIYIPEFMTTEIGYEDYMEIINTMIKPFKEYFEGEAVGWKDENGSVIESEPLQRGCSGTGYDPAL